MYFCFRVRSHAEELHTAASFHPVHSSDVKYMSTQTHTHPCSTYQTYASCKLATERKRVQLSAVILGIRWFCLLLLLITFLSLLLRGLSHRSLRFSLHVCLFSVLLIPPQSRHSLSTALHHPIILPVDLSSPRRSHCACLLIILSLPPSAMMLKFSPLHQFALTVNCVENNSRRWAARPGPGSDRSDMMGRAVSWETLPLWKTEPVQHKAQIITPAGQIQ